MLWHILIQPVPGHTDRLGERLALEATEFGLSGLWSIRASRGFLIEGTISRVELEKAARDVLADTVCEQFVIRPADSPFETAGTVVHVMPKPGVTDPEAESARALLVDLGYPVTNVRTIRTYEIDGPIALLPRLIERVLSNNAVELAVIGRLPFAELGQGHPYRFHRVEVRLNDLDDRALLQLSREGQL